MIWADTSLNMMDMAHRCWRLMAKKKNETPMQDPAEEPVTVEEKKLPKVEDLYGMKFEAQDGSIVMVRKAFKPRGKLEFYQPAE